MALSSSNLLDVLSDSKAALNSTSAADEAEMVRLIEAAVRIVEHEVGPLSIETHTEALSVSRVLSRGPLVSVTSATYLGVDYTSSVELRDGQVFGVYVGTLITYTYGHAVLQPEVRHILTEMVRRAWRGTQQGYRPGYGDAPEAEGGPQPALMLTRTDRANLRGAALAPLGFA